MKGEKKEAPRWQDDGHCFVCGHLNEAGLRLKFEHDGESLWTTFVPGKKHQGYRGVAHGGIVGILLDEVMVLLPYRLFKTPVVSAEMKLRLLKPVPIDEPVSVRGYFRGPKGPNLRMYLMGAEARLSDGTLAATAEGKCVRVR